MQKIKNIIISNKLDFICLLIITLYFILLNCLYGNHLSFPIIDIGHQLYLPEAMTKGKVLFKDLFDNIYCPLAYQINAIFYKIFENNIFSVKLIGSLNALLIVYLLYGISRIFTSKSISSVIIIFIITSCVFSQWELNYIFPSSYPLIYAYSTFLASVFFLFLYKKTFKTIHFQISWLFVGISMAFKYEFIPYVFVLLFYTHFFLKKQKISKQIVLSSFMLFLMPILLSFSALFFQGVSLKLLLLRLHEIKSYAISPAQQYLYYNCTGLYPNKEHFMWALQSFQHSFLGLFLMVLTLYVGFSILCKNNMKTISLFLLLCTISYIFFDFEFSLNYFYSLLWLPYVILFIFLALITTSIIKKKKCYDENYLLLIICSIISALKSLFLMPFNSYGVFAIPLLFICFSVFIVEYIPNKIEFIKKDYLQKSFFIAVVFLICISLYYSNILSRNAILLKTHKGDIYSNTVEPNYEMVISNSFVPKKSETLALNETLDYINKNINQKASILVIPEGSIINFLTDHPVGSMYDVLVPSYWQALGDNKIIFDIKKNSPDYIIINSRFVSEYGYHYFCDDYGIKTCNYIKSKYKKEAEISRHLNDKDFYNMIIYKKWD